MTLSLELPDMKDDREKILAHFGWTVNCWSPLEISNIVIDEQGNKLIAGDASGNGASLITDYLTQEYTAGSHLTIDETNGTPNSFVNSVLEIERTAQRLKNKVIAWTEGEYATFGVELSALLSKTEILAINTGFRTIPSKNKGKSVVSVVRTEDQSILTFKKSKVSTIAAYDTKYEVYLDGVQDPFVFMKDRYDISELVEYYLELTNGR